jgi:hypothetical protein
MKFKTLFERMNTLEGELLHATRVPRAQNPEDGGLFDSYYDGFRKEFAREYAHGTANPEAQVPAAMAIKCFYFFTWYQRAYETRTKLPAEPWDE